jgi:hypothetical protein
MADIINNQVTAENAKITMDNGNTINDQYTASQSAIPVTVHDTAPKTDVISAIVNSDAKNDTGDEEVKKVETSTESKTDTLPESGEKKVVVKIKDTRLKSNGKRPIFVAIEKYERMLQNAVLSAKKDLANNLGKQYTCVFFRNGLVYGKINVKCERENNDGSISTEIKSYPTHVIHYGPMRTHPPLKDPLTGTEYNNDFQYWIGFYYRDQSIWQEIQQFRGNNTSIPPFREAQIKLQEEGLYLIDKSEITFNPETWKYGYNEDIRLYRSIPVDGPFRVPHGYGFIPSLGPAKKHENQQFDPDLPSTCTTTHPQEQTYQKYETKKIRQKNKIKILKRPSSNTDQHTTNQQGYNGRQFNTYQYSPKTNPIVKSKYIDRNQRYDLKEKKCDYDTFMRTSGRANGRQKLGKPTKSYVNEMVEGNDGSFVRIQKTDDTTKSATFAEDKKKAK